MSRLTRRNALAAVAGLSALAVPSIAIAAAGPPPDPIFAAIEKHKQAVAAFYGAPPAKRDDDEEDEVGRLCGIFCDAAHDILRTVPTTLAGAAALLRHLLNCENRGEGVMLLFLERGNEQRGHGYDALLSSLASSLSNLDAVQS